MRELNVERDYRKEQIRKTSRKYLFLGFLLLFSSIILSIFLISYPYISIGRRHHTINYTLTATKPVYHNITDVPKDYVAYMDYVVISSNSSNFDMYIVFFNGDEASFWCEKLNFTKGYSAGFVNIDSHLSKLMLVLNSTRHCDLSLELDFTYYTKPFYFNFLSLLCLLTSLIGAGLAVKGLIYFIVYRFGFTKISVKGYS